MTTIVSKLEGPLSEIILAKYGKVLSKREIEMLDHCQKLGEVWIGYVDGHFVCCWGLIPPSFLSNQAYIWMWALESVPHQFLFVRHSQIQVRKFLRRYASITGTAKPATLPPIAGFAGSERSSTNRMETYGPSSSTGVPDG